MRVWKRVLATLICAGMLLPVLASAAEVPEETEQSVEVAETQNKEPAAEAGIEDGSTQENQETAESPNLTQEDETETGEDVEETRASITVTFMDGDFMLTEATILAGDAPSDIPQQDQYGNTVISWTANNKKVTDPSVVSLSDDTVYCVWHAPSLNTQNHLAYINGKGAAAFAPEASLTRGEAAKILYSLLETPSYGSIQTNFSDVGDSEWYSTPIYTLSSLGVINGYEDGNFKPTATITRAEFVTMLSQFVPISEGNAQFSDVPDDHWAKKYIVSAAAKGWVNGNPDGTFLPSKAISRAEAVKITNAALGRNALSTETQAKIRDNNINPFADVRPSDWYYIPVIEASTEHTYSTDSGAEVWTSFNYKSSGYNPGVQKIGTAHYMVDLNSQIVFLNAGFQTIDDKLYYVSADGSIVSGTGFKTIGEDLYYIQEDGSLAKNTTVGNFAFNSAGQYTSGNTELDDLVKDTIRKNTDESMTSYKKLSSCYLFLRENCKYLSRTHQPRGSTDWAEESAIWMFNNHKGNCYCFAAAFYYMAKQLGYDAQPISGGWGSKNQDHAWVMINGRIFDPEIEYAYLYRYGTSKYYNCFDINPEKAPFIYHFPE